MTSDPGRTHYLGDSCPGGHHEAADREAEIGEKILTLEERLEAMKRCEDRATEHCPTPRFWQNWGYDDLHKAIVVRATDERGGGIFVCALSTGIHAQEWAEFIANARQDLPRYEATVARLVEALREIRTKYGHVCGEFEMCSHPACQSSYGAWAVADNALREMGEQDEH